MTLMDTSEVMRVFILSYKLLCQNNVVLRVVMEEGNGGSGMGIGDGS